MFTEQLPSGRWRAGFRVNGRKHTATFDYRYEAEAWALDAEAKAAAAAAKGATHAATAVALTAPAPVNPPAPTTPAPTVIAHGNAWVDRRAGRLAAATLSNYRHHLRALTAEGLGNLPMDTIRRSDVDAWQTRRAADGIGAPTLNARLKVLRMVYRDAMAEYPGVVNHDPTHGVDPLPTADLPDRVLTDAESAALLLAAPESVRVPAMVALDAGLRWSEVFGLSVASVLDAEFLSVHQVVERDTNRLRLHTKGHRARVVPMTERLGAELVALAKARAEADGPDALLFPSKAGTVMGYWNWRDREFRPAVRKAKMAATGARGVGFHALRHTYGSRLAARGVPRPEIAALLGHADEKTTARYIHKGTDGHRLALVRDALAGKPAEAAEAV